MKKILVVLSALLVVLGCGDAARRASLEAEVAALRKERDELAEQVAELKAAAAPAPEDAAPDDGKDDGQGEDEVAAGRRRALQEVFASCASPCAKRFLTVLDEVNERWSLMQGPVSACAKRCRGGAATEPGYVPGEGDRGAPVTEEERQDLLRFFKRCDAPCAKSYVKHPEQIQDEDARRCFMMECG